jgi:DNA-binding MarR family transcriptional regulator
MQDNNNQDLLELVYHLEWHLRRLQIKHLREHGPMGTPFQGQGRILALLKLTPQISQKDLTQILDMRQQSLGELLMKLERQGFITRTPSEADRRGMDISLTEAGKAAADEDNGPKDTASFFDCLTPEEKTNLGDYLKRLTQQLEQQMPTGEEHGLGRRHEFGEHHHHGPFHRDRRGMSHGFGGFEHRFEREDPFRRE